MAVCRPLVNILGTSFHIINYSITSLTWYNAIQRRTKTQFTDQVPHIWKFNLILGTQTQQKPWLFHLCTQIWLCEIVGSKDIRDILLFLPKYPTCELCWLAFLSYGSGQPSCNRLAGVTRAHRSVTRWWPTRSGHPAQRQTQPELHQVVTVFCSPVLERKLKMPCK